LAESNLVLWRRIFIGSVFYFPTYKIWVSFLRFQSFSKIYLKAILDYFFSNKIGWKDNFKTKCFLFFVCSWVWCFTLNLWCDKLIENELFLFAKFTCMHLQFVAFLVKSSLTWHSSDHCFFTYTSRKSTFSCYWLIAEKISPSEVWRAQSIARAAVMAFPTNQWGNGWSNSIKEMVRKLRLELTLHVILTFLSQKKKVWNHKRLKQKNTINFVIQ